jgi:hypothetical protein
LGRGLNISFLRHDSFPFWCRLQSPESGSGDHSDATSQWGRRLCSPRTTDGCSDPRKQCWLAVQYLQLLRTNDCN